MATSGLLRISNLRYGVDVRPEDAKFYQRQMERKEILKGVNVQFSTGVTAILGPSGCGKTTLIDCLSGRKSASTVEYETYTYDGKAVMLDRIASQCGYVAQDDLMTGMMTVTENIEFSSILRNAGHEQAGSVIQDLVKKLGLQKCKDNIIGTARIRGVSGGERKRTAIGMELVSEPSLLFLDEPTTGLDSSTALAVVRLLRELGKTKTIVMSIHQPSSRIWDSFDRVLLMNKGKVIFHGTKHEALIWAAKEGHEAEEFENPADHLMDVIQQYGDEMRPFVSEDGGFEEINLNSMERTVSPVLKTGMVSKLDQFKALSWRSQIVLKREPALLRVSIGSSIFFGLFIGFLFYRMDLEDCLPSGLKTILVPNQNRIGAIFFVLVNLWQSALMYVDVFTESGMVFKREFVAGYYSVGPYLAAIYMFQVLPSRLMPAIIYSCTSYWMAGFVRMAGPFFMFMLMLIAVSVSSGCALLSFSVITTQPMVGQMLFIFFTMVFLLTTGFMPALPSLTWAVQWIKYISIHRYLLEGLTVNEYINLGVGKNDSYVENGVKYICDYSVKREFTKQFLSIPSMDYSIYWRNVGIIMGLCVAFMVMSYAGLVMRTKRNV